MEEVIEIALAQCSNKDAGPSKVGLEDNVIVLTGQNAGQLAEQLTGQLTGRSPGRTRASSRDSSRTHGCISFSRR